MAVWPFLLFVVLLVLALGSRTARRGFTAKRVDAAFNYPYTGRGSLLSAAELRFFEALSQAIQDDHCIMSKVRLEDVIRVRRGLAQPAHQGARNRIRSRHVDFVICRAHDMTILGCIELDDRSHEKPKRAKADSFLDTSLRAAGVTLLRFRAAARYDVNAVRAQLTGLAATHPSAGVARAAGGRSRNKPRTASTVSPGAIPALDLGGTTDIRAATAADTKIHEPVCPQCGGAMQQAQGTAGAMSGRAFLICESYPACRGMRPVEPD